MTPTNEIPTACRHASVYICTPGMQSAGGRESVPECVAGGMMCGWGEFLPGRELQPAVWG